MKIKLIDGIEPKRMNPTDAGLDLFTPKDVVVPARSAVIVDLGVAIQLPENTVGIIAVRSSLAIKYGITLANSMGIIDEGYRDTLKIKLINTSKTSYKISKGDRVAQLLIIPCLYEDCEVVKKLDSSKDRKGGIGSTGK